VPSGVSVMPSQGSNSNLAAAEIRRPEAPKTPVTSAQQLQQQQQQQQLAQQQKKVSNNLDNKAML